MNVLVTGTSSGLGFGLAKYYLDNGHEVYGISRKINRELKGYKNFTLLTQDITNYEEVKTNLTSFLNDVKNLGLIVLNAGILSEIKDLKDTSLDEIQKVMDVNVWANKILIETLFENVESIHQLVAISSGASVSGSRGWNAYSLSKATLNMLVNLYAKEYTQTHFCSLAPGLIDTGMQDYIFGLNEDYENKFPSIKKLKKAKSSGEMPDPDEAAIKVAVGIEKAINYASGIFLDIREM